MSDAAAVVCRSGALLLSDAPKDCSAKGVSTIIEPSKSGSPCRDPAPLINDAISPSQPPPPPPTLKLPMHPKYDSAKIASVYFDNKQLDVYHERLVRCDRSTLVRIR